MKRVTLRSIQFQGANGFPISLYRPVMSQIKSKVLTTLDKKGYEVENAASFTVGGCDLHGHVNTGTDWTAMVEELTRKVEERSDGTGPLICIGHSFGGGVLSALAARRPELVRHLILIEPPLFRFSKRFVFAFLKRIVTRGMAEKYHPVIEATLRKREVFSSRKEAREHLSGRRVFSTMDPEVLDIFINECLVPCTDASDSNISTPTTHSKHTEASEEVQVKFLLSKKDEAEVYHRVPYEIPVLSKEILNQYDIKTPAKYYYTKHKNSILDPEDYKWVANKYENFVCEEYNHSHFWPLEELDDFSDVMARDITDVLVSDWDPKTVPPV